MKLLPRTWRELKESLWLLFIFSPVWLFLALAVALFLLNGDR